MINGNKASERGGFFLSVFYSEIHALYSDLKLFTGFATAALSA